MRVIDSHTGGEPTRVILEGGPDLGSGSLAEQAERLQREQADFCTGVLLEPRGQEAMVAALLLPPKDPGSTAAVIYFNAAGNLGMCGHATIGLAVTLAHLGRADLGLHKIETPVGTVTVDIKSKNSVVVQNVPSYRSQKGVTLEVPGLGRITGDVAWGGNWFFLTPDSPAPLDLAHKDRLTSAAQAVRAQLALNGITGHKGAEIDHIEFLGAPQGKGADGRNFVLCPDGAYDRSPCGTGSSAKLACLAADGLLAPGETWVQESVIGSRYHLHYHYGPDGEILPVIEGTAHVMAETTLHFAKDDPFCAGIRAGQREWDKRNG